MKAKVGGVGGGPVPRPARGGGTAPVEHPQLVVHGVSGYLQNRNTKSQANKVLYKKKLFISHIIKSFWDAIAKYLKKRGNLLSHFRDIDE